MSNSNRTQTFVKQPPRFRWTQRGGIEQIILVRILASSSVWYPVAVLRRIELSPSTGRSKLPRSPLAPKKDNQHYPRGVPYDSQLEVEGRMLSCNAEIVSIAFSVHTWAHAGVHVGLPLSSGFSKNYGDWSSRREYVYINTRNKDNPKVT